MHQETEKIVIDVHPDGVFIGDQRLCHADGRPVQPDEIDGTNYLVGIDDEGGFPVLLEKLETRQ